VWLKSLNLLQILSKCPFGIVLENQAFQYGIWVNAYGYADQNPVIKFDPHGLSAQLLITAGAGAIAVCMKVRSCKQNLIKLTKEAKEACKNLQCKFKRAPANHKFPDLGYCQHYEISCWIKGKKGSGFHMQFPLPGTCRDTPTNQF
jgi:hypothetical protein